LFLFLDYDGIPIEYSNLPCSTDDFCAHPDLSCLGGIENGTFYPPRCSGKGSIFFCTTNLFAILKLNF